MLGFLSCAAFARPPADPAPRRTPPAEAAPAARNGCGDLLAEAGKKPTGLVFVRCTARPDLQGKPLRATYRIAGRHAAAAEDRLVKSVGLTRLKRSCCQWDAPATTFVDTAGREYQVTMVSDETVVTDRRRWNAIRWFEVIVERFTEEI
ncbi:DUF4952 domain-containing protein [Sphingomonas montana]|uniref:DUF4952 domain-containing protein n=1 Tax=Sphingomonas montana TaxID=1843236 RepID=UPI0013EA676D|nr:DUF4952 domain-containing protein [Sphingomonas montana]